MHQRCNSDFESAELRPRERTGTSRSARPVAGPSCIQNGLDPLTAAGSSAHTAQRFFASAYDFFANLFEVVYPTVRAQRTAERGWLTHAEQHLFRAAVVQPGSRVEGDLE